MIVTSVLILNKSGVLNELQKMKIVILLYFILLSAGEDKFDELYQICRTGQPEEIKTILSQPEYLAVAYDVIFQMIVFDRYDYNICLHTYLQKYKGEIPDATFFLESATVYPNFHVVRTLLMDSRFDPSLNDQGTIRHAINNVNYWVMPFLLRDHRVKPDMFMLRHANSSMCGYLLEYKDLANEYWEAGDFFCHETDFYGV